MTAVHPVFAAQRGGASEDEGRWLAEAVAAAELALDLARRAVAAPGASDEVLTPLLHGARVHVDEAARLALNAGAYSRPVIRWKEAATRELLGLAEGRWGRGQRIVVALGYEPLR